MQRYTAIRRLAAEAADNRAIPEQVGPGRRGSPRPEKDFRQAAHKGGAGLDQIQLNLGHASIKTTENSLGRSRA